VTPLPLPGFLDGYLVPVVIVAAGALGSINGDSNPPPGQVVTQVLPVDVPGPVGPIFRFRGSIGQGGEIGGYTFRASPTFSVTVAAATAGTTGQLRGFVRILDSTGLVVLAEVTPPGGVLGAVVPLDPAVVPAKHVDALGQQLLASYAPIGGEQFELSYQLEIVTPGAALDTVTVSVSNGNGSSGASTLAIQTGGPG
jgi:hypothetical protein